MRQKILILVILFIILHMLFGIPALGAEEVGRGVISGRNVNLRMRPDLSAVKVKVLKLGSEVMVLDKTNDWYKVRLGNGVEGWVFNRYLAKSFPLGTSRGSYLHILEIATFAKHFLGLRYVYGGDAPSGFDCSGFTLYIYKQFGYALPHNAAAQMQIGLEVDKNELLPGDLLFFRKYGTGRISHVGIYLGAGEFIHASSGSREIKISDLYREYYNERYAGARRILASKDDSSQEDASSS